MMVTRHILEQTRRNGDHLAAIPTMIADVMRDFRRERERER